MENYSRRHILKASLLTFGALCSGLPGITAACKEPKNSANGLLNWDEFVDKLERAAGVQQSFVWDQEAYVNSVAHLLHKLNPTDASLHRAMAVHGNQARATPDFAELLKTIDVQISLITFRSGEWLPHHNHPSMTGVLTVATGDLLVTSYDPIEESKRPAPSALLIKKLGTEVISPGKISTLTNTRRNIHFVKALSFTQVIDVFTPPYNADRTSKTAWYRVENHPVMGQDEVFVARPY